LKEVYNWFTEGFDTPMLIEAKNMLEKIYSWIQKSLDYSRNLEKFYTKFSPLISLTYW
jgi:hypothetical protein